EKAAALKNLETVRSIDALEGADDFDEDEEISSGKKQTLRKNKHDIESLLSFLEDSYNEGAISDKSYKELKVENVKKLGRINKLLSGQAGEATALESPTDVYDKFSKQAGVGEEEGGNAQGDDEEGGNFSTTKPLRKMNFQSSMGGGDNESGDNSGNGTAGGNYNSDGDKFGGKSQGRQYARASAPQLDEGRAVKPISFKEKLAAFSIKGRMGRGYGSSEADEILNALKLRQNKKAGGEQEGDGGKLGSNDYAASGNEGSGEGEFAGNDYGPENEGNDYGNATSGLEDGADDIMQSLKINPKKGVNEGIGASDIARGADSMVTNSKNEMQVRAGALLGKLGGIMGKFKKQQGGGFRAAQGSEASPDAGDENSSSAASSSSVQGGAPSWADKLPEEMTPQELAEYNKSRQEAESEASGNSPTKPEVSSSASAPTSSGGGGDEGNGASSAEVAKLTLELEKFKAKMETVENTRTVVEERIEHIMENIGELRTMLFEKESSTKEQESKLDKFVEMVSDLEPQRFAKELDKRDRQIGEEAMKVEKLETITGDMAQTLSRVRSMLEAIGSLKNIATVSKDIADRSAKIDNTVSKVERLADETGRVYIELGRKLNEFTLYRGKQDIMAESLKELVGMTENMGNKIDNYATRDDLLELKRALEDAKISVSELDAKMELASEGDELPEHIKDLQEEKEGLEQILESNEEEYIEGKIKEVEYGKMKDTHTKKLQTLRQKLKSELSKIHSEKVEQLQKSREIAKSVQDEGAAQKESDDALEADDSQNMQENSQSENDDGGAENGADASQETQPPVAQGKQIGKSQKVPKSQLVPQKITKDSIQARGAAGRIIPSVKARPFAQKNIPIQSQDDAPEEQSETEIVGEVDEAALEHAQETSQMEDEMAESSEREGESTGEGESENETQGEIEMAVPRSIPKISPNAQKNTASKPSAFPKKQIPKAPPLSQNIQVPLKTQNPISPPKIQKNGVNAMQNAQIQNAPSKAINPMQKPVAAAPTLSLKTEKPLPPKGAVRIFDIIKGASVGKRIALQAQATTIKKGATQCLIKLEDESGVIYGTFATGLKGEISLQGIVAKDPQGVPYIKISRAA
ncbi:MAG: hypothetical protein AABX01_01415, partial [Candidatus Micrarchaeota archaeon]